MKKKVLALILCAMMAATAVVGGTLAYFTDTDSQKNVMTTGNVSIQQNEQELKDGQLVDFTQNKPLMPMVDTRGENEPTVMQIDTEAYEKLDIFNPKMQNVVDKFVTVTNTAPANAINQDVYVRTILAFETATEYKEGTEEVLRDGKAIFKAYIGTLKDYVLLERDTIEIDGVEYVLAVKVYEDALEPQETSTTSLNQFFLSPEANNEVATLFGSEYTILALSQGTQTAGFIDSNGNETAADEALNTAFGDLETIDEAKLVEWLSAVSTNTETENNG